MHALLDRLLGLVQDELAAGDGLLTTAPVVPVKVAVSLRQLRALIDEVAGEEEIVLGRHGEGVAHEGRGVNAEGEGHGAGNAIFLALLARQ